MDDTNPDIIPLAEERASVSKRVVQTGRVRVRTVVEARDELVHQELTSSEVEVVRVPVDCEVDEAPAIRREGDLTIVPIVEERLVIEKRLFLKEEVHIRRKTTVERVEQPVTLRRQDVIVERLPADEPTTPEETSR